MIEATDVRDAAEIYAENCFNGGDPFNSIEVLVEADAPDALRYKVTIVVDFEPTFCTTNAVEVDPEPVSGAV